MNEKKELASLQLLLGPALLILAGLVLLVLLTPLGISTGSPAPWAWTIPAACGGVELAALVWAMGRLRRLGASCASWRFYLMIALGLASFALCVLLAVTLGFTLQPPGGY